MARMAGKNPATIPTKTANPKARKESQRGITEMEEFVLLPIAIMSMAAEEPEPSILFIMAEIP